MVGVVYSYNKWGFVVLRRVRIVLLDAVSVWNAREYMSWFDGCSVLRVVKVVLYVIEVSTVARALGISDGVYLFHWALVVRDRCGGVMFVAWWDHE